MHTFTHVYPIDRFEELVHYKGVRPPPDAIKDIPFAFPVEERDADGKLEAISLSNMLACHTFKTPRLHCLNDQSLVIEATNEEGEQVVLFIQQEDYR